MHADTKSGKLTEIFRQHIVGTNQELDDFKEWYHRIQRLVNSLSGDLLDVEDTRALGSEYHLPAVLECHRTAAELLEMMKDESPFACFGSTVRREMLPPFHELRRAVQELTTETWLRFQGRRCKGTLLEADCCRRFLDAQRYLARHARDHSLLVNYKLIWDRRNASEVVAASSGSDDDNLSIPTKTLRKQREKTPPPQVTVTINVDAIQATIFTPNGEEIIDLPSSQVARWLKVLCERPRQWIPGSDLVTFDRELDGARTSILNRSLKKMTVARKWRA